MLGKAILVTILGALVTGGAVYVAQNPEVLDPLRAERSADMPKQSASIDTAVNPRIEDDDLTNGVDLPILPTTAPSVDEDITVTVAKDKGPKTRSATDVIRSVIRPASRPTETRSPASQSEPETAQVNLTVEALIDEVMAQAEQIGSPDLRDQAYLDIVDYAVRNQNFDAAMTAMEALRQPQLRDTARSKIAVQYARIGQTQAAFDLIEAVEIEELRDFMRLQVIEALIVEMPKR